MVTTLANYEDKRKLRLEENKKRMELLNLHKLARSLKPSPTKPHYSSPVKKAKAKASAVTTVRRSSRMADKPPPNYKEYAMEPLLGGRRIYKRRDLLNRVYASNEDRVAAFQSAEELEQRLGSEHPTFIKPMLQSHVTGGFWLSFPLPFCSRHLPDNDEMFTLEDKDEKIWEAKYLARKNGLSGGWRGFSIDHELVDGDCLIFQLINPTTFKVYIVRVNSSEEDEEQDQSSS